uniref:Protein TsetseEP domain-containing protein n=1 Tax=Anopheles atroparvus TaxID=41427 RepID=A0A182IR02_ANOAO
MKLFVVLLALACGANAERPGAIQVISTFKEIAPQYAIAMNENDAELEELKNEGSDKIVTFHTNIITLKETYVMSIINQEDGLKNVIATQNAQADTQCMSFIQRAANENVNLVGVSYTTCINKADDSLNVTATSYYGRIGNLEVAMTDLRLLDVFRGDNVFYTPESIVTKLRSKLTNLNTKLSPLATDLEEELDALQNDLEDIRDAYIDCMTAAEQRFRGYIALAQTQLTAICSGTLAPPAPPSTSAPEVIPEA